MEDDNGEKAWANSISSIDYLRPQIEILQQQGFDMITMVQRCLFDQSPIPHVEPRRYPLTARISIPPGFRWELCYFDRKLKRWMCRLKQVDGTFADSLYLAGQSPYTNPKWLRELQADLEKARDERIWFIDGQEVTREVFETNEADVQKGSSLSQRARVAWALSQSIDAARKEFDEGNFEGCATHLLYAGDIVNSFKGTPPARPKTVKSHIATRIWNLAILDAAYVYQERLGAWPTAKELLAFLAKRGEAETSKKRIKLWGSGTTIRHIGEVLSNAKKAGI